MERVPLIVMRYLNHLKLEQHSVCISVKLSEHGPGIVAIYIKLTHEIITAFVTFGNYNSGKTNLGQRT